MTNLNNVAQVKYYSALGLPICYLVIDEVPGRFSIMQYSASFAKNEVPQGTVTLGTGKQVNKSIATAVAGFFGNNAIYNDPSILNELDGGKLRKARVFLNMSLNEWEPGNDETWAAGDKCIFEGYYAGVGYTRAKNTVQVTVSLVHRLVDLTFSSLYSPRTHPSNGASFASAANLGLDCAAGGGGEKIQPSSEIGGIIKKTVRDANDFGEGITEALKCLTQSDLFTPQCREYADQPDTPAEAAKEVLDAVVSKTGEWRAPLDDNDFKSSVAIYLGRMLDSNQGTTYWDFLVNKVCATFLTSVIPFPSKDTAPEDSYAYIVPNMPGYKVSGKELFLNDYSQFQLRARLWKPLYAVVVNNNTADNSGAGLGKGDQTPKCTGGMFPSPDAANKANPAGQLLITSAPPFLKDLVSVLSSKALENLSDSNQGARDFTGIANMAFKGFVNLATVANQTEDVLTNYARTLYVNNAINGRLGSFETKLRFDIAPGTILKINRLAKKQGGNEGSSDFMELPVTNFAQVSRVTHNINAEAATATTSFDIVHVRTEKENGDKSGQFSTDIHPFFEGNFNYAPLVDDWKF